MSSTQYFSLDWRSAPSSHEIIKRILARFTDLDARGFMDVRMSNARGLRAASLQRQEGRSIILREDFTVYLSRMLLAM